jgi:hypothetical protein
MSATGSSRWPPGPTTSATASKTTSGGVVSAEGAALQTLPPTVAMLRVCIDPTIAAPSASAV